MIPGTPAAIVGRLWEDPQAFLCFDCRDEGLVSHFEIGGLIAKAAVNLWPVKEIIAIALDDQQYGLHSLHGGVGLAYEDGWNDLMEGARGIWRSVLRELMVVMCEVSVGVNVAIPKM